MKALLRWLLLLLLAAFCLQLFFVLRIALMAWVDPQSTTFERSEAWRVLHDSLDRIVALLHRLIPRVRDERFRDQLAGLRDSHISSREALDQRNSPSSTDA